MQIVLLGYMGSGKSTIGKLLSEKMNLHFIDLDEYIEEKLNVKIPAIFDQEGEIYFRKKEHQLLLELLSTEDNMVLATGGGTPCYAGNIDVILNHTDYTFYLNVGIPELVQRLYSEKGKRPLIKHLTIEELPEFIGKHLFERSAFYTRANYTIYANGKSPQEIIAEMEGLVI